MRLDPAQRGCRVSLDASERDDAWVKGQVEFAQD